MFKLVPYWKSAWRFVSVQLGVVATLLTGFLIGFPEAALHVWSVMPQELKSTIPPSYMPLIGAGFMALSVLGRIIHQPKTAEKIETKMVEKQLNEPPAS